MTKKSKSQQIIANGLRARLPDQDCLPRRFILALKRLRDKPIHSSEADLARKTKEKLMDKNASVR